MADISAATGLLPLLAYPAHHVRTPAFLNPVLRAKGHDAIAFPWQVAPGDLATVVAAMRVSDSVRGMIVTVPHKTAMAALCDTLSEDARALDCVNVVRRRSDGALHGDVLDGEGFVSGLKRQGHRLEGKSVLLLGAGGAARSIALALCRTDIAALTIANRDDRKAELLAASLAEITGKATSAGPADPASADIVINATTLGMKPGDPLPFGEARFRREQLVADVVMNPAVTALLRSVEAAGAAIHTGDHMIVAQLHLMAAFFFAGP